MGWKLNIALRTKLLAPAATYATTLDGAIVATTTHPAIVMIDGPAAFRSAAVGTRPARAVVEAVLDSVPATADIAVFFDCPLIVPDERETVHVARAASPDAQTMYNAAALDSVRRGTMGAATWQGLFSTRKGKAAAYAALAAATRAYARQSHRGGGVAARAGIDTELPHRRFTVTDPHTAAVWGYPFDRPSEFAHLIETHPYGEAEAQLAMAITTVPQRPVLVVTIDTDILLQVAYSPMIQSDNVTIALARIWRNEDTHEIIRSAAAGRKRPARDKFTRQWELVSCAALTASKAPTPDSLFWLLAAGGVDYCGGLQGFGWTQDSSIARATSIVAHRPVIIYHRDSAAAAAININALGRYLVAHRKSRRRENDPAAFAAEIDNLIYCWRYYMWEGANRTPKAGPTLERIAPRYKSVKTVTQWIARAAADPIATRPLCSTSS